MSAREVAYTKGYDACEEKHGRNGVNPYTKVNRDLARQWEVGWRDRFEERGYLPPARLPRYDAVAVNKEIAKDKRISKREARLIHALLRGRV